MKNMKTHKILLIQLKMKSKIPYWFCDFTNDILDIYKDTRTSGIRKAKAPIRS